MISLGMGNMGIGLAIHLQDRFSANARKISNQFTALHGNAQKVQAANLRAIRNASAGVAMTGALGIKSFAGFYKTAADFDMIMRTVKILTNASTESFRQMNEVITQLGTNSIYTIGDVASAMEYLVRSGFKGNQALAALPGIVHLGAAAGGAPIGGKGGTADILASIMHDFNKAPKDAARTADLLAKAANISASDVMDIGQALKYTGYQAHRMGYDMEPTLAMLTVLSNAGLKGGIAGRSLNAMLVYLNRAASSFRTGKQAEAFKAIGLTVDDIVDRKGQLKDMGEILAIFGDRLGAMNKVEASGALATLFMMRGERAMMPLLEKSIKIGYNFRDAFKELMGNSSNYAKNISNYIMAGPKGSIMRLEDTLYAFKVKMGEILQPWVEPILNKVISVVTGLIKFSQTPVGKTLVVLAAGLSIAAAVGGTLLFTFAALKLATMGGIVTWRNMGATLTWAWNSATAAAIRYGLVQRGVTRVGPGVVAVKGVKGFQKVGTGTTILGSLGLGGAGATSQGMKFLGLQSLRLGSVFGMLGNALKVITGPIGWIVGFLGWLVGFKNIIKAVIFGLGSFVNMIAFVVESIMAMWPGSDMTFDQASKNLKNRTASLAKAMGFEATGPLSGGPVPEDVVGKRIIGGYSKDELLDLQRTKRDKFEKSNNAYLQMNLDGKKVGEVIFDQKRSELMRLLKATN